MLVKQKVIGVFKKMYKHVYKARKRIRCRLQACPFSSDFNFACIDGRVTAAACNYCCSLVVSPTITNCCKKLHLKLGRGPRSVFENVAIHEN